MYTKRGQQRRSHEGAGRLYTFDDLEDEVFLDPIPRAPANELDEMDLMEAGLLSSSSQSDNKSSFEVVSETDSGSEAEAERGRRAGMASRNKPTKPPRRNKTTQFPTGRVASEPVISAVSSEDEEAITQSQEEEEDDEEEDDLDEGQETTLGQRTVTIFRQIYFERSLARNLGFEPTLISPPNTEFLKFLLYDFSVQHVTRVNQCIPMPAFLLTSLINPIAKTTSAGERDLTRGIVTHAVLVNYFYQAKTKVRSMQCSLNATIHGQTMNNIATYVTNLTPGGRAAALALHFLMPQKAVMTKQYQACLRRLTEELRKRRVTESPSTLEILETIRDYNLIFPIAPYTNRGALYLYRNNLQKLSNGYRNVLKLLSSEKLNEEHFVNDLAFMIGAQLMLIQFEQTLHVLRAYIVHHLHNLATLIYIIYVQFPSLRGDYIQVTEAIYRAVTSHSDEPLFQVNTWLFDYLRAVRNLEAVVCPDYMMCALRQWTTVHEDNPITDYMFHDPAIQDSRIRCGDTQTKLLVRNLCFTRMQGRPTSRQTPVEHVLVPTASLNRPYLRCNSTEEREVNSHRNLTLRSFLETNGNHPMSQLQ
ncbi:Cy43 [Cynomolgus cytomegalovirus]|uniref:Protein UL25 n=1 Tax=Cynomolgus macaque cytomegalovirus strain Mauritius TaxID=1690255 RepID=A0A0K1GZM1_9BETA|nr:Cy43 [Cynomolgus cytomegalovirus]AKT72663.1 protein UL25 [Cynomolgus macaque cytomegalovirus strain Mauritius]APT39255.1 Cy43 [Cynomolgus cytomegalovirus]APT39428.1 Cy43 [Cynomolgus cytomegalovirus]APT39601.1 Cy43 [Cynomolgus cytomegalovirus]APT39774.1 Cy43 [Cynomolgus cytomegalovirus]